MAHSNSFIDLSDTEEFKNVISKNRFVVVDYHASWCGPCRRLGKWLDEQIAAGKYSGIRFYKIDVDNEFFEDHCKSHGISGIPHIEFYRDGVLVKKIIGLKQDEIDMQLESMT